jgi:hypothetical protein
MTTETKVTHTPGPCGCKTRFVPDVAAVDGNTRIIYCPTHAQAPAMLALIRWLGDGGCSYPKTCGIEPVPYCVHCQARGIQRAVEG